MKGNVSPRDSIERNVLRHLIYERIVQKYYLDTSFGLCVCSKMDKKNSKLLLKVAQKQHPKLFLKQNNP